MLLLVFLLANGNDEIVDNLLVDPHITAFHRTTSCSVELVFYGLFASEEGDAVKGLSKGLVTHQALLIQGNDRPFFQKRRAKHLFVEFKQIMLNDIDLLLDGGVCPFC